MKRKQNLREKGSHYERIAGAYLEKKGYRILEYNFRCPYSEIDIVARDGKYLVYCEVKYRRGKNEVRPLEAIDSRKQKRISMAALFYIARHNMASEPCRFDVIGISGEEITHIENAFDYGG